MSIQTNQATAAAFSSSSSLSSWASEDKVRSTNTNGSIFSFSVDGLLTMKHLKRKSPKLSKSEDEKKLTGYTTLNPLWIKKPNPILV